MRAQLNSTIPSNNDDQQLIDKVGTHAMVYY